MKSKLLIITGSVLFFGFARCSEGKNPQDLAGSVTGDTEFAQIDITQAEISSLQWMREEEMLAHDVYAALSELYTIPVFKNITKSEMYHTNLVAELLVQFGLEDPAAEHVPGEFKHPEIKELYDQLVEQGSTSYAEAIKVGLQIEDLDIADLDKAIAEEVQNEDILFVYNNLLRGSGHHLNAFWMHASRNSIEWEPEHISPSRFQEIIKSDDSETDDPGTEAPCKNDPGSDDS